MPKSRGSRLRGSGRRGNGGGRFDFHRAGFFTQHESDDAHGQINGHRQPRCGADAEAADEPEAGGGATDDRPQRVESVQQAQTAAQRRKFAAEIFGQHRQGSTHERGGDQQQADEQDGLRKTERVVGRVGNFRVPEIQGHQAAKDQREQQGERADEQFQNAVEPQWIFHAVGDFSKKQAADGQAAHEAGQHGGRRINRVAKNQREMPHPDHFINQPAKAGSEEEQ